MVSVDRPLNILYSSSFFLVDVSDIFYFFFCLGRGKGESEAKRGGGSIFFY